MIGLVVGYGRWPAQLKIELIDNGRHVTPHQSIFPQKETFVGKNVELEQLVMAGGGVIGAKGLGQNGR